MAPPIRKTRARASSTRSMPAVSSRYNDTHGSHSPSGSESRDDRRSESVQPGNEQVRRTRSGRKRVPAAPVPVRKARPNARRPAAEPIAPVPEEDEKETDADADDDEEQLDDSDSDENQEEEEEIVPAQSRQARQQRVQHGRVQQQLQDTDISAEDVAYDDDQPWQITVAIHSAFRFGQRLLDNVFLLLRSAAGLVLILLLLSALGTFFGVNHEVLPSGWATQRTRMVKGARLIVGLPEYERGPKRIEQAWIYFQHMFKFKPGDFDEYPMPELQPFINANFAQRLMDLEAKVERMDDALKAGLDLFPRLVVVDLVDKRLSITDEFYHAISQKLIGDSSLWAAFLEKNQKSIDELENSRLDRWYDTAAKQQDVISASTALELIRNEHNRLLDFLKRDTAEERATFIQDVKGIAEEAVIEVLEKHSGSLLQTGDLQKHHYIENALLAMHNYNFFAPKNGAKVIELLTSPTAAKKQPNFLATLWAGGIYPPAPPATALDKWSEYSDAWCATASTNKGKAQLGVATKYLVTPSELIVEHIPATGSLSINAAPRDIELWMDAGSIAGVAEITAAIAKSARYKSIGGCGEAPGAGFVCVASGRYDIHSPNWVQRFPTFLDAETFPEHASHTFVARVRENWGGDQTCLYQLRLHGLDFDARR